MQQKTTIFKVLVFQGAFLVFFGMALSASAKTIYVNSGGDDSENDGSSGSPYKTLEKAAEEVNEGEGDDIKIGKGKFAGGVTFDQGVSIQGAGKGSTTITGTLTFKKKAELKNLSIQTKSKNAVALGKSSDANIKNVDIRDYAGIGIWVTGGTLTLEDSRLGSAAGKGIYAEPGSKLTVVGNTITGNKQEGIDIRNNTRGTIKNNTITDNSESGIEIIVGSTDFVISGNDIKNNGASGIAHQFYESYKKFGAIIATGNTISGNDKYGLDCNKPQRGDTPVGYWADSITLEGNTLGNNKRGDVGATCKFIEAKTEEEQSIAQEQIAEEQKQTAALTPEGEADFFVVERQRQENLLLDVLTNKLEEILQEQEYNQLIGAVEAKPKKDVLIDGWRGQALNDLEIRLIQDTAATNQYQEHLREVSSFSGRTDIQERVNAQYAKLKQYQEKFNVYKAQKGLKQYASVKPSFVFPYVVRIFYALPF